MRIDVLTLFPEWFAGPLDASLLGRARDRGLVSVEPHDLRDWATDRHRTVDEPPYGGGAGMVLKPEPFFAAVEGLYGAVEARPRTIVLTPRGRLLDQALVAGFARERALLLLCGRYEGIDERVHEGLAHDEVSIGDYVLAGGEVAAAVLIEAVTRLLPGVMGNEESASDESFAEGLLEYPQYTRPLELRGMRVPEVLRSGDHGAVARWRRERAEARTRAVRPDLWAIRDGPDAPDGDGPASPRDHGD
ncbi:tRNA (guanosine(37)-N1)-methyltransferase TrmD [Egibacter rhizosphaerae]|uniref:tRNA (guanine-N(1)-)-methyltransferase n=1 Tax=Egibacter rhizosphaerae TaxID=1670831 RepID=A0A411YCQ0_9ACTN|nr:tRNA (guanosine(37)-N1)-methyltransferase TrmD [Egibacter rhizosphaerae]QBI18968.1 tRNA (guanosine(37)-N1)-methyltransferase TrmD [Egibacter rhizosphaerae]